MKTTGTANEGYFSPFARGYLASPPRSCVYSIKMATVFRFKIQNMRTRRSAHMFSDEYRNFNLFFEQLSFDLFFAALFDVICLSLLFNSTVPRAHVLL